MKNDRQIYICSKCGAQNLKWAGRCAECGGWGTLEQDDGSPVASNNDRPAAKPGKTQSFKALESSHDKPAATGLAYWDRVLSGGFVSGSVTLLGGEPGIGKSTLLAQLGLLMCGRGSKVLYVTGEESPSQIRLRLARFVTEIPSSFDFLDLTQADVIAATIREHKPALTIIDSVQTLRLAGVPGEAGNPTQIRASSAVISEAAKQTGSPVVLVGQVTKEGELAGPRLLEHLVDSVLMMEGDRYQTFRLLRVVKHRFGNTEESAVLNMTEQGLSEVTDPSAAFIADRPKGVSGSIVTCLMQGTRPLLVEIQALVSGSGIGIPSRKTNGLDLNRVNMILAVLGRRAGLSFGDQDVFLNAVGGVEAKDPSIDLALALALASAKTNQAIPADLIALGEVGLAGEIRPVPRLNLRLKEAARLGFKTAITPFYKNPLTVDGLTLVSCKTLVETLDAALKGCS